MKLPVEYEWWSLARKVVTKIAHEHDLTFADLRGRKRLASIVQARAHAAAVLRWSSGLSFPEIGIILDKNHTSVMYLVGRHEALLNGELDAYRRIAKGHWAKWAAREERRAS